MFKLNVLGRNIQNVIQIDDNQLMMIIIMVLNLVTDLIELIITIIKKRRGLKIPLFTIDYLII